MNKGTIIALREFSKMRIGVLRKIKVRGIWYECVLNDGLVLVKSKSHEFLKDIIVMTCDTFIYHFLSGYKSLLEIIKEQFI